MDAAASSPSLVSPLDESVSRRRAHSHKDYLKTLQRPSAEEIRRISDIQLQKERIIDGKYHSHTPEEHEAATKIQKAYRGHRSRRELVGLTLNPSARWMEAIREMQYRAITAHSSLSQVGRARAPSAADRWNRVVQVAAHAGAGEGPPLTPADLMSSKTAPNPQKPDTMLMDLRYFLEMVDQKHRYGTNLQIYHEEWLSSQSSQNFFYWLDHGEGRHISLPLCDRDQLEQEQIRYLSREERKNYLVSVDDDGKLRWDRSGDLITTSAELYKDSMHGIVPKDVEGIAFADDTVKQNLSQQRRFARKLAKIGGKLIGDDNHDIDDSSSFSDSDSSSTYSKNSIDALFAHQTATKDHTPGPGSFPKKHFHVSPATILNNLLRKSVKPGTWIYVADTLGCLYVGIKNSGSFQHASFLSGARISSAGAIGIENGVLTYLSPLSGHYRPTTKSFRLFIGSLKAQRVDLRRLRISGAYRALLGMEYYGKTKEGFRKMNGRGGERKENEVGGEGKEPLAQFPRVSAVDVVQGNWEQEHQRAFARWMDGLHIRRRSGERDVIRRGEL